MEEYLTVKELSQRVKLAVQTIYNFIHEKKFILGEHYLKPTPKKILFKWSEIQIWMGESTGIESRTNSEELELKTEAISQKPAAPAKTSKTRQAKSLINI